MSSGEDYIVGIGPTYLNRYLTKQPRIALHSACPLEGCHLEFYTIAPLWEACWLESGINVLKPMKINE